MRKNRRAQGVDVYLDVDGVILPVFDPAVGVDTSRSGWRDWRKPDPEQPRVRGVSAYSPVMIDRLRRLGAQAHIEVHWCTVWRERTHDLAALVGLPTDWPVLDADMVWDRRESENRTVRSWWKRDAVQEHHAEREGRAVVWIDDDLGFDEDARLWMRGLREDGLGISPDTMVGLTSTEFRRIERFALH